MTDSRQYRPGGRSNSRTNTGAATGYMRRVTRARPLADLIGKTLEPACRKRGFAAADLLSDWPEIVGERYAGRVQPIRLDWPRGSRGGEFDETPRPATLVVQTDGATALLLTHEMPQLVERINGFFGWAAVERIRILQRPVTDRRRKPPPKLRPLTGEEEAELAERLAPVEGTPLGAALERLGRAVLARTR